MDEDFLFLLVPVFKRLPREGDVSGQLRVIDATQTQGRGVVRGDCDVLGGEGVDRHLLSWLPDEQCVTAVDHGAAVARAANPARGREVRQLVEWGDWM